MKTIAFRLMLLVSGLFRNVVPEAHRKSPPRLGKEVGAVGNPRSGRFDGSGDREVWLQSWTVRPF